MTPSRASSLRAIFRAAVIIITAFGIDLSAEQAAAVQLGVEALLRGINAWRTPGE
jgi:hypothetical protein